MMHCVGTRITTALVSNLSFSCRLTLHRGPCYDTSFNEDESLVMTLVQVYMEIAFVVLGRRFVKHGFSQGGTSSALSLRVHEIN